MHSFVYIYLFSLLSTKPWTYFLHLSLSSVILIDFHGGVLSTYWCCLSRPCVVFFACVHLALFLALRISFCRRLFCFLMVWPQYASFFALTVSNSSIFTAALLRTHLFVFFAVHETHSCTLLQATLMLSLVVSFVEIGMLWLLHIFAMISQSPAPCLILYGIPSYTHSLLRSGTQDMGTYPPAPVAHSIQINLG